MRMYRVRIEVFRRGTERAQMISVAVKSWCGVVFVGVRFGVGVVV